MRKAHNSEVYLIYVILSTIKNRTTWNGSFKYSTNSYISNSLNLNQALRIIMDIIAE